MYVDFDKAFNKSKSHKFKKTSPCKNCKEFLKGIDNPYYIPTDCEHCKKYNDWKEEIQI